MKFASEEEAVQYLSNLTGKDIKIASDAKSLNQLKKEVESVGNQYKEEWKQDAEKIGYLFGSYETLFNQYIKIKEQLEKSKKELNGSYAEIDKMKDSE